MVNTKLASNVMGDISKALHNKSFSKGGRKALVVFNGSNIDILKDLDFINNFKNDGFEIDLGFSFIGERLLDSKKIIESLRPSKVLKEEDIFQLSSIIKEYSIVIGPNITMNTLSKVSLGMIDGFVPNIIWSFLYHGKKVYINFDSVRNYMGESSKSKAISNQIEEHIEKIISMGAIEITNKKKITSTKEDLEIRKDLITERDITKLDKNQRVLVVNSETLITPLARDKAKELGIKIERGAKDAHR